MPNRGDKLYDVWADSENGYILRTKVVTFLEESIVEGASISTYVCKDETGRKFRYSTDLYATTERAAWERCLKHYEATVPSLEKQLDEMMVGLINLRVAIEKMRLHLLLPE